MDAAPVRTAGVTIAAHGDGTAAPTEPAVSAASIDAASIDAASFDAASFEPATPTGPGDPTGPRDPNGPATPVESVGGLTTRHPSLRLARRTSPIVIVVVLVVVWVFVAEPLRVASVSMEPSLRAGQHVLVDKVSYRMRRPRRNELVVFPQPGDGRLAVKRVVGLAGDSVALEDGVLVVNGVARHESYVDHRTIDSVYFGPEIVPADRIFVMGDNRGSSIDSRSYGSVEIDTIVGRVIWHA